MKKLRIYILTFILITCSAITGIGHMAYGKKIANQFTIIKNLEELPTVGSLDNFKMLIEKYMDVNRRIYNSGISLTSKKAEASIPVGASADHSATNTQVQGVDEGDIVKTDGKYIYQVNRNRIIIIKAYPASEMNIENMISFDDMSFVPIEIYLDDKYLIVLGQSQGSEMNYNYSSDKEKNGTMPSQYPPSYRKYFLKTMVYDISNPKEVLLKRVVETEGNYVSSRKIGSNIYLVTNKRIDYWYYNNGYPEWDSNSIIPSYRDSAAEEQYIDIDFSKIKYFPGIVEPNFMLVTAFNIERDESKALVSAYLGSGQNIYMSENNLYVAAVNAEYKNEVKRQIRDNTNVPTIICNIVYRENTVVYKFALKDNKVTYLSKGEVPGRILNQFSMDEDGEYFRIATTTGNVWDTGENISKNNLYVMDKNLSISGKIEGIAPGEKIYSVRFMGDRGYMVTFRKVDPLFVIDLKDAKNPRILGALKIPGYSDYLHPYDENHIIGFGKDAEEAYSSDGRPANFAFYQGMKIAIFDVSDVANPKEKFSIKIGDRGTTSELLYNHKALLFSKEKNILSFPITVYDLKEPDTQNPSRYGEFAFQGAYVYGVDLEKGFTLRGKITHLTGEDYMKAGQYWYDSDRNVERIIYIGNNLYTISKKMIKAHGMYDLSLKAQIEIE